MCLGHRKFSLYRRRPLATSHVCATRSLAKIDEFLLGCFRFRLAGSVRWVKSGRMAVHRLRKWPLSLEVTAALLAFVALQGLLLLFWKCDNSPAVLPRAQLRSAWQSWPPAADVGRALAAKPEPATSAVASTELVTVPSHKPSEWRPAEGRKRIFLTLSTGHTGSFAPPVIAPVHATLFHHLALEKTCAPTIDDTADLD